jgi:hypothetical protein
VFSKPQSPLLTFVARLSKWQLRLHRHQHNTKAIKYALMPGPHAVCCGVGGLFFAVAGAADLKT